MLNIPILWYLGLTLLQLSSGAIVLAYVVGINLAIVTVFATIATLVFAI